MAARPSPVRLSGLDAAQGYAHFLRDPIGAVGRAQRTFGRFVVLERPFRGKATAITIGPEFNREVLGDPNRWRTSHIMFLDKNDTAARRVGLGLISLNGRRHAYYRRLLSGPIGPARVEALSGDMGALADEVVAAWPVDEPVDLWRLARTLMQTVALSTLFGGDVARCWPVAEIANARAAFAWTPAALACPINAPFTPYGRMRRESEALEAGVLDWSASRRGATDVNDLFSLIVNSPREDGAPPDPALIAGLAPTAMLTVYHTCQTALIWTLVLLAQHPGAAARLAEEVRSALADDAPSLATVGRLTWLDQVVKESLRILPPVPLQSRSAHYDTVLAGWPMRARSRVLLSAFHTNRAPELYPDPEHFRPERWNGLDPSPFEFAVFSAGPRNCPGQAFGVTLVKLALAAIVSRWRIEIRPGARIDYRVRITMAPRAPIPARLRPQDRMYKHTPLSGAYVRLVPQLRE